MVLSTDWPAAREPANTAWGSSVASRSKVNEQRLTAAYDSLSAWTRRIAARVHDWSRLGAYEVLRWFLLKQRQRLELMLGKTLVKNADLTALSTAIVQWSAALDGSDGELVGFVSGPRLLSVVTAAITAATTLLHKERHPDWAGPLRWARAFCKGQELKNPTEQMYSIIEALSAVEFDLTHPKRSADGLRGPTRVGVNNAVQPPDPSCTPKPGFAGDTSLKDSGSNIDNDEDSDHRNDDGGNNNKNNNNNDECGKSDHNYYTNRDTTDNGYDNYHHSYDDDDDDHDSHTKSGSTLPAMAADSYQRLITELETGMLESTPAMSTLRSDLVRAAYVGPRQRDIYPLPFVPAEYLERIQHNSPRKQLVHRYANLEILVLNWLHGIRRVKRHPRRGWAPRRLWEGAWYFIVASVVSFLDEVSNDDTTLDSTEECWEAFHQPHDETMYPKL